MLLPSVSHFVDAVLSEVPTGLIEKADLKDGLRAWLDGPGKGVLKFTSTLSEFIIYAVRQAFLPTYTPRNPARSHREGGSP